MPDTPVRPRLPAPLPGERFKAVPGTNDKYWLSNYGRLVSRQGNEVLQPQVKRRSDVTHITLQSELQVDTKRRMLTIGRMVYYLFVSKFAWGDRSIVICYSDGNPLNCHRENLRLETRSDRMRASYRQNGRQNNFSAAAKPVNQYSLKGNFLRRFPSAADAAAKVGVGRSSISVAALRHRTSAGFYWRYGKVALTITPGK